LIEAGERALAGVERGFSSYCLHDAAAEALGFAVETNRYLEQTAPWKLARDPEAGERLATVLAHAADALALLAELFSALLPDTARLIREQLTNREPAQPGRRPGAASTTGVVTLREGTRVSLGAPLFPKLEAWRRVFQ
jgi:methionyl-tRNA synthetase